MAYNKVLCKFICHHRAGRRNVKDDMPSVIQALVKFTHISLRRDGYIYLLVRNLIQLCRLLANI